MQSKESIEQSYAHPDPWGFQSHGDDHTRKSNILSVLSGLGPFKRALDLGCGEGWITKDLPSEVIYGFEISDNAASRFPKNVKRCFSPEGKYDLIVATGVLYHHYDHRYFLDVIKRHAENIVLTCNIKDWEVPEVEKLPMTQFVEMQFDYREFTQRLRVFKV